MRLFDHRSRNHGAVLQHVLEIHQIAIVHVLGIVIHVVEVNNALVVRLHDLLRQQQAAGDVLADLAGHVVALHGIHRRVLVRVLLLDLLVVALDQAENAVVRRVRTAHQRARIPIADVLLRHLERAHTHDRRFDHFLNLLDRRRAIHAHAFRLHRGRDRHDLLLRHPLALRDRLVRPADCGYDF